MDAIVDLLADGMDPVAASMRLAKGDKKRAYKIRRRMRKWIQTYPEFADRLALAAKSQALAYGVAATPAVGRRAERGRTDAFKALNELSGLHNPRVQHEHSGEVKITISAPRPHRVETVDSTAEDA